MRRSERVDVLLVGGGPSGAWAARCLAKSGARVRVFDHSHPREKPCGGGVTGRALNLVGDVIDRRRLPAVPIVRGVFEDPRTSPSWVTLDDPAAGDRSLVV